MIGKFLLKLLGSIQLPIYLPLFPIVLPDEQATAPGEVLPWRDTTKQFAPAPGEFEWPLSSVVRVIERCGCMAHVRKLQFTAYSLGLTTHRKELWVKLRRADTNEEIFTPIRYIIGYRDGQPPTFEADWWCASLPK
jgi:hypothetical protein